jgi:hypothetical protein
MLTSVVIISLCTSLLLFYIKLPWFALIPLIVSMYIIFTNGKFQSTRTDWQFSRYHVLFWLRCTITVWLSLLLDVFSIPLLTILCALLWLHMLIIWVTVIWDYNDEFHMFNIWYYFIGAVLLWYIPVTYWLQNGMIAFLLFPVVTFLLYAWWSFFIHPLKKLPLSWHYRTAIFFLISFLSSIILYFFSVPVVWWTAALVLYTAITWFLVYQMMSYISHEKRKHVYAEDILAGKKVIQPSEWARYPTQVFIARIIQKLHSSLRTWIVRCATLLLVGGIYSAFFHPWNIPVLIIFVLLTIWAVSYYYAINWWSTLKYPTLWPDVMFGTLVHAIFAWVLYTYSWSFFDTTAIFIAMARSIIHHAIAIMIAKQSFSRNSKRKYWILYWYAWSNWLISIWVILLFSYLWLWAAFTRAVNLLYIGVVGTMLYFFSQAMQPRKKKWIMLDEDNVIDVQD